MPKTESKTIVRSGGITFLQALTILFIGLKLTGFIDWSWIWVLCPFWAPILIVILIFIFVFTIGLGVGLVDYFRERR